MLLSQSTFLCFHLFLFFLGCPLTQAVSILSPLPHLMLYLIPFTHGILFC